jgi:hypothetical protein
VVWFSEDTRAGFTFFFFFFLEQQWPPLSLMDAAGVFSNKKPFVGNLWVFFNQMLARVGSIFKAHILPCVLVFVYRAPSGGCPGA